VNLVLTLAGVVFAATSVVVGWRRLAHVKHRGALRH